ncbi:MAG: hypothetical protein MJE12_07470 [Alphaproteobacteria bacterium]|nr:hypothetical protein [Alphaproteobacteria bacterium]
MAAATNDINVLRNAFTGYSVSTTDFDLFIALILAPKPKIGFSGAECKVSRMRRTTNSSPKSLIDPDPVGRHDATA